MNETPSNSPDIAEENITTPESSSTPENANAPETATPLSTSPSQAPPQPAPASTAETVAPTIAPTVAPTESPHPQPAPKSAPESAPVESGNTIDLDGVKKKPLVQEKDSNNAGIPQGPAEKAFTVFASLGLLIPLILLVLQTCLGLDARSLWFSDEVRHGAAYEAMRQSGEWFILTLNGNVYPDKPPLYFWFLYGLDQIPSIDPPRLFLFAAALCALLFTASTWILARALGYDKRTSLAAALVLLSTFSFLGITHYARMDLLFAAFITMSHVCLYRGWVKPSAPIWLALGFTFAALACLVKGPLGLAFPLVSSILFLAWRGTFRRASARDGAFGFALMLSILLLWVGLVTIQDGGQDYLGSMFGKHMIDRAFDAWHHKQPWWYYLVNLPLGWLPWTLVVFFLPWERLPKLFKGGITSRTEAPGHGWAWISLLSGVLILSALSGKVAIYTLPLYPFLAVLTAQGVLSMGPRRSKAFFLLLALVLFLLALIFGIGGAYPYLREYLPASMAPEALFDMSKPAFASALAYVNTLQGLPILAGICLVFSIILLKTRRTFPGGSLLIVVLFFTVLAQPLALITAPSLDTLMSPRPQADSMREYVAKGFHMSAFYTTSGTYTYHMGGPIDEINEWEELADRIATYPKLVVATRVKRWDMWQEKPELYPEQFRVVNTQWIAERQYVVLVRDADAIPAPQPAAKPSALDPESPPESASEASPELAGPQEDVAAPGEPDEPDEQDKQDKQDIPGTQTPPHADENRLDQPEGPTAAAGAEQDLATPVEPPPALRIPEAAAETLPASPADPLTEPSAESRQEKPTGASPTRLEHF